MQLPRALVLEELQKEIVEQTPHHRRGCHQDLMLQALLGQPPQGFAAQRLRLGKLLHTNLVESLILVLVTLELSFIAVEFGVEKGFICLFHEALEGLPEGRFLCEGASGERTSLVLEAFEVLSKLIVSVFALEMLLKIIVAPLQLFRNPWHLLDLFVVLMNLLIVFSERQRREQVTLALRWWRMVKFLKLIEEEAVLVEEHLRRRYRELPDSEPSAKLPPSEPLSPRSLPPPPLELAKKGSKIGGGLGAVLGSSMGAAVGVLPALFTLGLSIPIFATVGGTAGLLIGSALGGATGLAGAWAVRPKAD